VSKIRLGKMQGLVLIRWSQRGANGFSSGLIAFGSNATNRDQDIGLRIVGGSTPASDRIGDDGKAGRLAHLAFEVTLYVHDLTGLEVVCRHINRIQESDAVDMRTVGRPQDIPCKVLQVISYPLATSCP
jgi:hypothetical protein